MSGKVSRLIMVGTSDTPRSAMISMVSSSSPVPCSMPSMPARTSSATDCSSKQWAVTLAPSSWAASMASAATSAGHSGRRSPTSRSIQSPTSFTQPSPRRAWRRTSSTISSGSTSSAKLRM